MSIKIVARQPLRPVGEPVRRLSTTEEIAELLDGKVPTIGFPNVPAEALVGRFCAGHLVTVSRKKNELRPDLERLEGYDEVWCLCVRAPKPGWRLLGRFISKNHLVVTRPWDKIRLANNYDRAAQEVIDDWEKLTGSRSAYSGKELGDYLSGVFRDVDVKED